MVVTLIGLFAPSRTAASPRQRSFRASPTPPVFVAMIVTYLWITGIRGRELVPTRQRASGELAMEPDGRKAASPERR